MARADRLLRAFSALEQAARFQRQGASPAVAVES